MSSIGARRVLTRLMSMTLLAAGLAIAPMVPPPEAAAATSLNQVSCDSAARMFQLREGGAELWYSSVGNPASDRPVFYNWRKVYDFSADRPGLAVAAHTVVNGFVKLFVTDRDGGLRVYNFDMENAAISSVNNLRTGPGPYDFSRLASDGHRLYGTKEGKLYAMTSVTTTAAPKAMALVKTIGYPLALWGNAGNDQELMYTDSSGVLRAVDVSTTSSGWTATLQTIRSSGWAQAGIASPGAGVIFRDVPDHLWRHLIDIPTHGTNTTITDHKTIANLNTPNEPITSTPDVCSTVTTSNVVSIARSQLGVEEGPEADKYFSWAWPGLHTAKDSWCAAFVSWVVNHKAGVTTYKSAAVGDWVSTARSNGSNLSRVSTPRAGDLVAFDWDGNGDFVYPNRHIAIVDHVGSNGVVYTVEGNWSGSGPDSVHRDVHNPATASYDMFYIRIG